VRRLPAVARQADAQDLRAAGQRQVPPLLFLFHRASPGTSNGIKLALAWGCVGIPLVWGIIQTLVNAIKAFQ
jgi:hypothetical protein